MLGLRYRRLKFNQPSAAHSLMHIRLQATKFDPSSWRITMDDGRLRVGGVAGLVLTILAASLLGLAAGSHPDVPALMAFKLAVTDPKNFLSGWNASDDTPCLWVGITCTNISATELRRVLNISLSGRSLGGPISPGLGSLTKLDSLILSNNNLTGPIPGDLFNALTLSGLYLSGNVLTGQIPAEVFQVNMTLRVLDVSGNNITGSIPQGMGTKMTSLERLDLAQNLFTGSIPVDFGNLTKLEEPLLNLSHNQLSGAIPSSLANLKVALDVSYNNLSGPIPLNSYFNKQGPSAYSNNPFLCGLLLNISCTPASSSNSSTVTTSTTNNKRSLEKSTIIGIAVGGAILFSLMASLLLFFCLRKLRRRRSSKRTNASLNAFQSPARCETGGGGGSSRGCLCSWRESGGGGSVTSDDDDQDEGDLVHLDGVLGFSLEELLRASAYVLGKSGVGIVYKAVLDDGVVVAVRRLGEGGANRCREFEAEVRIVGQVRHPNVVTLHSYYWTADEKLLIYDFLPNGSLENALHGRIEPNSTKGPLTWQERLRIAKGAAHGLAHIHECSPRKHVHGDIKPSNILLDAFLEARIADFGLQRLLNLAGPEPFKQVDSRFRGEHTGRASSVSPSPAYAPESGRRSSPRVAEMVAPFLLGVYQAPEAATAKKPNQKSDVYSFGVVLLELLTGRSPFTQLAAGELDLVAWMRVALQEKRPLAEIFDPYLVAAGNNDECKMIETLQVALACIAQSAESRPKMKQVAEFFEQLQPSS